MHMKVKKKKNKKRERKRTHMVSKPQRQEREGNYILRQTLNDSDIQNYSSKGSGYFYMGGKDINSHMTFHCICSEGCTGLLLPKICTNFNISSHCHSSSGRTDPMLVSCRQNKSCGTSFWQQDYQSIQGQKNELLEGENGREENTRFIDLKT